MKKEQKLQGSRHQENQSKDEKNGAVAANPIDGEGVAGFRKLSWFQFLNSPRTQTLYAGCVQAQSIQQSNDKIFLLTQRHLGVIGQ